MKSKDDKRFRVAALFLSFSLLLVLISDIASGEGLYTRVDELSCGNTVVRAYTTCSEDSHDLDAAVCTDQHFLFISKRTGAVVKVNASGKPVVGGDLSGGKIKIRYDAVARDWACLESGAGPFLYLNYSEKAEPGEGLSTWEELLDLKGKRLGSNREIPLGKWSGSRKAYDWYIDTMQAKFNKVLHSKGVRGHPAPLYEFEPIQIFETDRTEKYFPWGDN